jgi:hypothetical protein
MVFLGQYDDAGTTLVNVRADTTRLRNVRRRERRPVLFMSAGNITSGTITMYGLKNSV